MDKKKLEYFRRLFIDLQKHYLKAFQEEDKGFVSLQKGDEIDLLQQARDLEIRFKLAARKRLFLKKIEAALERIDRGTFGECLECSGEIADDRLYARPMATLCIHCKEESEKVESQILYQNKSHTSLPNVVNFPEKKDESKVLKFDRQKLLEDKNLQ